MRHHPGVRVPGATVGADRAPANWQSEVTPHDDRGTPHDYLGGSVVTMTAASDIYYDPFDHEIRQDPYPLYKRLRDEAPLWHNEKLGFYVVSRFEDVERGLVDRKVFSSARGIVLGMIEIDDVQIPPGLFIAEDAPFHTMHRAVVSRVFTPKAMEALEPQVRAFTARRSTAWWAREASTS